MRKKILILLVISFLEVHATAQVTLNLQGVENTDLKIWKDDNTGYRMSISKINDIPDTLIISSITSVYNRIQRKLIPDSGLKKTMDSIQNLFPRNKTLEINIATHKEIQDGIQDSLANGKKAAGFKETDSNGFPLILIILFGLCTLLLGFLLYRLFWNRERKEKESSTSIETSKTIVQVPIDRPVPVLPSMLASRFEKKVRKKSPDEAAGIIVEELDSLEHELNARNLSLEVERSRSDKLEQEISRTTQENADLAAKVAKLQSDIADQLSFAKEFNTLAESAINQYYTKVVLSLERDVNRDSAENERLILQNMFTFAFLGISLLKKQVRDASALDTMNIDSLKGENPEPKDTVTEKSQFNNTDPLAYYTYHLLKKNGIWQLDNVLVHGYRIGEKFAHD